MLQPKAHLKMYYCLSTAIPKQLQTPKNPKYREAASLPSEERTIQCVKYQAEALGMRELSREDLWRICNEWWHGIKRALNSHALP